jgi:hypothetical protein
MKKTVINGIAVCLFISLAAFNGDAQGSSNTQETSAAPDTAAPGADGKLSGTVLETMDSGGYTYLQIDTGLSKPWVAIPQATVKVGDKVDCQPGMVMKNFSSKTLDKTFDTIVFSSGLGGAAAASQGGMMGGMGNPQKKGATMGGNDSFASAVQAEGGRPAIQQPAAESGGSLGAITPFTEIKVEKASGENGYTVEEIFSQREELNGKTVVIQGKVVKFSPMIMGMNWIHLQDGTGDPTSNTHDLVITTSEEVTNGDVITVEGVLAANKDFGAGYKYEAIVEKAKTLK